MELIHTHIETCKDDWFKDHEAIVTEANGVTIVDWKKPDSNAFAIRYLIHDHHVYVSGDLGDAVFKMSADVSFRSLSDIHLHYFLQQMTCHSRVEYTFNRALAKRQIEENFLEWCEVESIGDLEEESLELYEDLIATTDQWSNAEMFEKTGVWGIYEQSEVDWFDSDYATAIGDCGKELAIEMVAYWQGLRLAYDQYQAQKA